MAKHNPMIIFRGEVRTGRDGRAWICVRDTFTQEPAVPDWATEVTELRAELDAMSDAFGELASEFEEHKSKESKNE
jgi:hypothetical protein